MSSRAPFVRKHKKAPEQSGLCSSHRKNQAGAQRSRSGLGRLQAPYLIWLAFAAYLNAGIWLLNR